MRFFVSQIKSKHDYYVIIFGAMVIKLLNSRLVHQFSEICGCNNETGSCVELIAYHGCYPRVVLMQ